MRYVVCAAIRKYGAIIIGPRHYDATMHALIALRKAKYPNEVWSDGTEPGFIDQHGVFLDRHEAWIVATEANQIRRTGPGFSGPKLHSENLY